MTRLEIVSLHIYPVKSCAGVDLREVEIGPRGPRWDREWMWVDATNRFITQRQHPVMALITTKLDANSLALSVDGHEPLIVSLDRTGKPGRTVEIWSDTCRALDEGDDAERWLKSAVGIDARLVRMGEGMQRKIPEKYARPESHVSFTDTLPFLITSQDSLDDLNARLADKVPMNRFRPNVVVKGGAPYAEDDWKRIRLGRVEIDVARGCTRCAITTVDQSTGKTGKEPLRTLSGYRREGTKIIFGQNAIHLNQGTLKIGDAGEVLSLK